MKKIFGLVVVAALMLTSCAKEIDNGIENVQNGTTTIQFSINTGRGPLVTYAGIAEGDQGTIGTVDIYAFVGGALVGSDKMNETTDYTMTEAAGVITITATPEWLSQVSGETVNFYFVANDADSKGGAHIPTSIPTSEDAFKELLTNKTSDADSDGYYEQVELAPYLLFTSYLTGIELNTKIQEDVELSRRDARFDIKNELYNGFTIDEIYVTNANIQANMFGNATNVNTPAKGSHKVITGPDTYDATTYLATSVFHLYPTTLGKYSDGKTELMIKATLGGKSNNYTLKNEMEILPNHRYIIELNPVSLTFIITAVDYESGNNGDALETELGGDAAVVLNNIAGTGIANYSSNGVYTFDAAANTLTFETTTTYGTSHRVNYIAGDETALDADIIVNKVRTTTYSGFEVTDKYTVNVPQAATGSYKINLDIYSPGGEGKQTISFVMGATDITTGANAVTDPKFADWIKENVGSGSAVVTPEELEKVESIDFTDLTAEEKSEITIIDGLENFPNLKEIVMPSTPIESIDISKNPNLTKVTLSGTALETIDVSNNPRIDTLLVANSPDLTSIVFGEDNSTITYLHIGNNASLASIDLSKLTALKELHMYLCTAISNIDVSHNTNLTFFNASQCSFASVDLSKNLVLEKIDINQCTNILSLDISKNIALISLTMSNTTLTGIDLSANVNLTHLNARDNPELLSLDVSMLTKLYLLYVNTCPKLELVDISGCKDLKKFRATNTPALTSVYIWDGFNPTNNLWEQFEEYYPLTNPNAFKVKP